MSGSSNDGRITHSYSVESGTIVTRFPDESPRPSEPHDAEVDGRFVVLTHDHPFLHWDLMLETADALKTWRLLVEPHNANVIAADELPDHRKHYLDYEGPVSGGRGQVSRWDSGVFKWTESAEGQLRFALNGDRLNGEYVIKCTETGCEFRQMSDNQSSRSAK